MWRKNILLDKNPNNLSIFDKRFNPPFIATKPSGHEDDLLLQEVDSISINSNSLEYFTPNIVSLQFSIAEKSITESKVLLDSLIECSNIKNKHLERFNREVLINESKLVCDYLEKIQIGIVFSFTAVETFANLSIPTDYDYTIKSKRCHEHYSKAQIERYVNWKVKLSKILVDIYRTNDIASEPFWSSFCELVKIRDEIIHQKSMNDTAYFETFFDERVFQLCLSARKVVMFFKESAIHLKDKLRGNEHLWPILDDKVITIGCNMGFDIKTRKIDV